MKIVEPNFSKNQNCSESMKHLPKTEKAYQKDLTIEGGVFVLVKVICNIFLIHKVIALKTQVKNE